MIHTQECSTAEEAALIVHRLLKQGVRQICVYLDMQSLLIKVTHTYPFEEKGAI